VGGRERKRLIGGEEWREMPCLKKGEKKKGVTPQKRPRKMMPSETGEDG
jgi:hypothetical protein